MWYSTLLFKQQIWNIYNSKLHFNFVHLDDYLKETKMTLLKTCDVFVENMHQFVFKRLVKETI